MPAGSAPSRASRLYLPVLFALCLGALAWQGMRVGFFALHPFGMGYTLTDQIAYIDAARSLERGNGLTCGFVYPSTAEQPFVRNYLYMPGHAALLAASFLLLGEGVWQAYIPCLLAFALTLFFIYRTCRLWEPPLTAFLAAATLAFYPPLLSYAWTAMSEIPVVAVVALALWLFLASSQGVRFWVLPAVAALLVLFKESTLFLLPVLVVMGWAEPRPGGGTRWPLAGSLALTVLLVAVVLGAWSGRPQLFYENLWSHGDMKYLKVIPDRVAIGHALPALLAVKIGANVRTLAAQMFGWGPELVIAKLTYAWLAVSLGCAFAWVRRPEERRRWLAFLVGGGVLLLALLVLYDTSDYKGVRLLLAFLPLQAWVLARLYATVIGRWGQRVAGAVATAAVLLLALAAWPIGPEVRRFDWRGRAEQVFLRRIAPSGTGMLVGPLVTGAWRTLVVPGSLNAAVPADARTFRALAKRYSIGTLVVTDAEALAIGQAEIDVAGLVRTGNVTRPDGIVYAIYRRSPAR